VRPANCGAGNITEDFSAMLQGRAVSISRNASTPSKLLMVSVISRSFAETQNEGRERLHFLGFGGFFSRVCGLGCASTSEGALQLQTVSEARRPMFKTVFSSGKRQFPPLFNTEIGVLEKLQEEIRWFLVLVTAQTLHREPRPALAFALASRIAKLRRYLISAAPPTLVKRAKLLTEPFAASRHNLLTVPASSTQRSAFADATSYRNSFLRRFVYAV